MRDLLQVIGWLEDGQHLIQPITTTTTTASFDLNQSSGFNWNSNQQLSSGAFNRLGANNLNNNAIILPDGQLYIQRVQLKDANKSFRCQVKNVLNSKVTLSSLSGRLFVTGEF